LALRFFDTVGTIADDLNLIPLSTIDKATSIVSLEQGRDGAHATIWTDRGSGRIFREKEAHPDLNGITYMMLGSPRPVIQRF
jgi:hypothetical protein